MELLSCRASQITRSVWPGQQFVMTTNESYMFGRVHVCLLVIDVLIILINCLLYQEVIHWMRWHRAMCLSICLSTVAVPTFIFICVLQTFGSAAHAPNQLCPFNSRVSGAHENPKIYLQSPSLYLFTLGAVFWSAECNMLHPELWQWWARRILLAGKFFKTRWCGGVFDATYKVMELSSMTKTSWCGQRF